MLERPTFILSKKAIQLIYLRKVPLINTTCFAKQEFG